MKIGKPVWQSDKSAAWDLFDVHGERKRIFVPKRFLGHDWNIPDWIWVEKMEELGVLQDLEDDLECVIDEGDVF